MGLFSTLLNNTIKPSHLIDDIYRNLNALLTTRQGTLRHMPDFGLPDLMSTYQDFPFSKKKFISNLQKNILSYEPRIKSLYILEKKETNYPCVMHLTLKATIKSEELMQFESFFLSGGKVKVQLENVTET